MLRTALILTQHAMQFVGDALLLLARGIAWLGRAVILEGRWCGDRAREWRPRLWERNGDARPETEERRP